MTTTRIKILVLGLATLFGSVYGADRIELKDGSVIVGKNLSAEAGKFKIETNFAGTLEIAQDKVKSFSTDAPVNVAVTGSAATLSQVEAAEEGIKFSVDNSPAVIATGKVSEIWRKDSDSPEVRKLKEIAAAKRRHWAFEASAAISGRTGVAEKFGADLGFKATLANNTDKLVLTAAAQETKDDGVETAHHLLGGADYSSYDSSGNGWYARSLLEEDKIKLLDLRSSTAVGLGHKLIKNAKEDLEIRLGVDYLYEKYSDNTSFESPGLDVAILHSYQFKTSKLVSQLSYTPSFKDFGNYRLHHESAFEIPLLASMWKLKLGLTNDYNSRPPEDVKRLDTTYFTSLLLSWK